jgi:hypothetical protein
MFWGNGDTSKLSDEEKTTLAHLRRMVETGHIVALTHAQAMVAMEALTWYSRWTAFAQVLTMIRNVGLLAGGVLALWWGAHSQIADWLKTIAGS